MQTNPKISVVMAAFNEEKHIQSAVDSILSQTYEDFELIVVNDGSRDNTLESLKSIADDRVKIISNTKNNGLPKSLNTGIAQARGCYIARQDADDFSLPQRLQKQFDYLQKHPNIAVLGTATKIIFDDGSFSSRFPSASPTFADLLKSSRFVHGSVMMRKDVLEKVGCYNEIFRHAQDYDLWLRITKEFPAANLQESLYVFRSEDRPVKRLLPTTLYRLLARNLALGKVGDEIIRKIKEQGIEVYYDYLTQEDKIFYHDRARKGYMKYNHPRKALEHHRQQIKLHGLSFRFLGILTLLKLSSAVKKYTSKTF